MTPMPPTVPAFALPGRRHARRRWSGAARQWTWVFSLAAALLTLTPGLNAAAAATGGDDAPAAESDLISLIAQLNSPAYPTRDEAHRRLLADPSIPLDALADSLSRLASPEQRHRLLDVLRHRFVEQLAREIAAAGPDPAGSLGVWMDAGADDRYVHINATLHGFPAYVALQPGDLIAAVNDVSLDQRPRAADGAFAEPRATTFFRSLITDRPMGATVKLSILRQGEPLTITTSLGSMAALQAIYPEPGLPVGVQTLQADGSPVNRPRATRVGLRLRHDQEAAWVRFIMPYLTEAKPPVAAIAPTRLNDEPADPR